MQRIFNYFYKFYNYLFAANRDVKVAGDQHYFLSFCNQPAGCKNVPSPSLSGLIVYSKTLTSNSTFVCLCELKVYTLQLMYTAQFNLYYKYDYTAFIVTSPNSRAHILK